MNLKLTYFHIFQHKITRRKIVVYGVNKYQALAILDLPEKEKKNCIHIENRNLLSRFLQEFKFLELKLIPETWK